MLHYSLTRSIDEDPDDYTSANFTERDPINAAHLIAAYFNTVNRPMLNGFALGVVSTQAGTVEYDGKHEKLQRPDPWSTSQTLTFNATQGDADTILTLFGKGETPTFTAKGKFTFTEESKYAHINRDVLEAAYAELQAVKELLADAGFETIRADAGVRDLVHLNEQLPALAQDLADANDRVAELERRDEFERHARSAMEQRHGEANEAARAELISYVKKEFATLRGYREEQHEMGCEVPPNIPAWERGALDVLAKFLVVTGEADKDESHAVARRLVEQPED